jgi:hypothetical protein
VEAPRPIAVPNPLPLRDRRAVGGPVPLPLLGAYVGVALAGWIAAAVAALVAAPDLAAARFGESGPVLAVHLLALGVLPFAVSGASFHLLPVMLRNDLPSRRALWLALPLLAGGFLAAPGIAFDRRPLVVAGASALGVGMAIVVATVAALVVRAPAGRMLVASRAGVGLSAFHATAALALGLLVFSHGDEPTAGVPHDRWMLVHLHVALLGWLALLIVSVGRTLAPMLALAPAAPVRAHPFEELALTLGLWLLAAGIALDAPALELAGGAVALLALGRFAVLLARTVGLRRAPLEAPLAHLVAGALFLLQAAGTGVAAALGADRPRTVVAEVIFLLVGWAGGVVLGHAGKLLSLSAWVWWPPGPRPKQAWLYPRRTGLVEAAAFALGVEALGIAVLADLRPLAFAGGAALCVSAALAAAGAVVTWRRRPGGSRETVGSRTGAAA